MQPLLIVTSDNHPEWLLHENHPLSLVKAAGTGIECMTGRVWITAVSFLEDVELRPGEIFVVPNRGLVLVEGVAICRVRVRRKDGLLQRAAGRLRFIQWAASHRRGTPLSSVAK